MYQTIQSGSPRLKKKKKKKKDDINTLFRKRFLSFWSNQPEAVATTTLALAGFSYGWEGHGYIKCEDCGLRLSADFKQHFDPLAIHQVYSQGKCQYLKSLQELEGRKFNSQVTGSISDDHSLVASRGAADVLTLNSSQDGSQQQGDTHQLYSKLYTQNIKKRTALLTSIEQTLSQDLTLEVARRQTFASSQANTDVVTRGEMNDLAAGGIYLNCGTLRCAFCNFSLPINDNCRSDYVASQHLNQSPSCSMLTGIFRQHANVPDIFNAACWGSECDIESADTSHLGIISKFAKCPELAVIDRRMGTFLAYPHKAFSGGVELLANSGYFYSGKSDGRVTCFWCGCESANWRTGEDPWLRHARTSASCQFVIQEKGEEYVRSIVEEFGVYREKEREDRITTVTTRMMRPRWDSLPVQRALEMGLERNAVKAVVGRRIKRGEPDFKYVAEMIRDINDLAVPERVLSAAKQSPWLPEVVLESTAANERQEDTDLVTDPTNHSSEFHDTEDNSSNEEGIEAANNNMATEQTLESSADVQKRCQNVMSQLTCKICLSGIIGTIFLPCGHLVCCTSCSAAMVNCPLCRQEIKGTVKANFNNS